MTRSMTYRSWALAVFAILALGGCNRDWDASLAAPAGTGTETTATVQDEMGTSPRPGGSERQQAGGPGARAPFADLPDRGDLVGYPQQPVVRRDGAYTWHRADVSEQHALRAILDGELRITAPNGEQLAFEYERHVEHPTGDWTWVGRLRDAPPGRQAILTFGAKAVFGDIAQSVAAPLRLAMRDGASWLVETDPALLAGVESRVLRPEKPDFLLPPLHMGSLSGPRASGDTVSSSGESVESSSSTTSSTTTVVDVVVGYTSGFAVAQGGDSQARTRINFLVDVGNQAYVNSQIDARVRLVHAMQVNYPDATDNGEALQQLTGYDTGKSGSDRFVTPDSRFSSLRQARETYGADLVTLVRKFNDPENDGCGIAWLIGGGLKNITQGYEYFGYSVVSDGIDQGDDGKNYFCRDETMVHEFGHNMGSAHDIETAKGDDGVLDDPDDYGRYRYSFGYRTGPEAGDFYTIMAYREKRDSPPYQTAYRVFSNSNITYCGGFPCGTSNAHNAHSLRQTIPVIAGFRAKVVPDDDTNPDPDSGGVHADFNGDGTSDLLWRHAGDGANAIWLSADRARDVPLQQITDLQWRMVGVGDFDGDGRSDILWRNQDTGANAVWYSGEYAKSSSLTTVRDTGWQVVGVGDFNADGRSDILWRHAGNGSNAIWPSAQYSQRYNLTRISNLAWKVVGVGDVDGDGFSDVVWRHASTGANAVWFRGQYSRRQNLVGVSDLGWQVVGVADFDGDGRDDLLWRNQNTGQGAIWPGASHAQARSLVTITDVRWRVEEVGDYDGDGLADIIWRHAGTGANAIWPSADYGKRRNLYRVTDLAWQIQPQ